MLVSGTYFIKTPMSDIKLTILDREDDPIFMKGDFISHLPEHSITLEQHVETNTFDGTIIAKIPNNTTHLIMHALDRIGPNELKQLRELVYIGICSNGWWDRYFDRAALAARGIVVTNNPHGSREAVAEAVFTALLAELRLTHLSSIKKKNAVTHPTLGKELAGRTMGIIGLGQIGSRVAAIAHAFGMRVISTSAKAKNIVAMVSRKTFFTEAHIISLHVPRSADIVLNAIDLALLRDDAIIVNAAGFDVVDTKKISDFLRQRPSARYIHLAHLDPLPTAIVRPLPNALLYPTFASRTEESLLAMKTAVLNNLFSFIEGKTDFSRVL